MQQHVFDRYINYLKAERNVSPYTVRNYTTALQGNLRGIEKGFFQFLTFRGIDRLEEVDNHVIRDYLAWLKEREIAKASIARTLSAVRSFFRYLVREGMLPENPTRNTSSPKLDKRLPSFLTINETTRLLAAPDLNTPQGQRDRALLELLYASGLRVSELAGLDIEHVDLETREIRVWGKGSKERIVLMGEPAARALTAYLKQGRQHMAGEKKSRAFFLNRAGGRLTERSVQTILQECATMAGIDKKVHPHLLRHTFATHLLDGGADLRVVQELLGHASLSSTQIYTHVSQSQARKVYHNAHPMAREREDNSEEGVEINDNKSG